MLEASGVTLMLSAYAADPILEGKRVCGLFVENKTGRQAIPAKVVIDATGEADVARRAGAPVNYPDPKVKERGRTMGIRFVVAGIEWDRHDAAGNQAASDKRLAETVEKASAAGGFSNARQIGDLCTLQGFGYRQDGPKRMGFASGYIGINWPDNVNQGDGMHVARLEVEMRKFCFETAEFWKKNVPGFEDSYLYEIAPFLGSRGGPSIEGEVTLTVDDIAAERRFDDVIFISEDRRSDPPKHFDVPYRVLVPKEIDGLLACGRSAGRRPGSLIRGRPSMMQMGQVAGAAAALSVQASAPPRGIDVKELQRLLIDAGFHLGDLARLKQLGLC